MSEESKGAVILGSNNMRGLQLLPHYHSQNQRPQTQDMNKRTNMAPKALDIRNSRVVIMENQVAEGQGDDVNIASAILKSQGSRNDN